MADSDSAGSDRKVVGVGYGAVLMLVGLLVGVAGLLGIQALGDQGPRLGSTTATEEELTTGAAIDAANSTPEAATVASTSSRASTTTEAEARPTTSSPDVSADDQADGTDDVRTYRTAGGDIVLAFGPGEVRLVSVEVNDGFELEQQFIDGRLQIDLRDGMTHSQLVAWVAGGPQVALDDH